MQKSILYATIAIYETNYFPNSVLNIIQIRIRIILFWIYKYGTISVTIIYKNKHDSRINPGNRYIDICRSTSVPLSYRPKEINKQN